MRKKHVNVITFFRSNKAFKKTTQSKNRILDITSIELKPKFNLCNDFCCCLISESFDLEVFQTSMRLYSEIRILSIFATEPCGDGRGGSV